MKRFLRIALIVLGVLGFTGYFAFSTFLFNPLEGDYEYDIAALVSRDVDLFVARADLVEEFDADLGLRSGDDLAVGPFGGLAEEQAFADLVTRYAELRAQVRSQLEQLPVSAHPLDVFGGRDLALAAYFEANVPGGTEWAAVGRGNWLAKSAYAALQRPGLFGLEDQGFTATEIDGVIELSGGQLTQPMFFARIRDVVVVSNGARMPGEALEFDRTKGQDSFFTSPRYHDEIARRSDNDDDIEFFVRTEALAAGGLGADGPLFDVRSQDFVEALLARLFTFEAASELAGAIGLGDGLVSFDLAGKWDVGELTDAQRRIYRRKTEDQRDVVRRVGRIAPADSAFVIYAEVDLGELLRQAVNSAERALIDNLETEIVQPIFSYATVEPLIADIEAAFSDRIAIIVAPNRFVSGPEDAPTNDRPTFAYALALWIDDPQMLYSDDTRRAGLLDRLEDGRNAPRLGLEGRDGAPGIYTNTQGGFPLTEYWSPLVPGTGHVATGVSQGVFLVTNHFKMIGEMFRGLAGARGEGESFLVDRSDYTSMMNSGPVSVSATAWFDPESVRGDLGVFMRQSALEELEAGIDWERERPRIQRELLAEFFPGERWGSLSAEVQAELDARYLDAADVFRAQYRAERLPQIEARIDARLRYLSGIERALASVKLDDKAFELDTRIVLRRAD